MNKERRKEIQRAAALLEEAKEIITQAKDDEQEYRDNMPESIAAGDKGDTADSDISALETAENSIDDAISELENVS